MKYSARTLKTKSISRRDLKAAGQCVCVKLCLPLFENEKEKEKKAKNEEKQ